MGRRALAERSAEKDAAFGLVADIADAEIAKIAKKAPAKKKTK